jgi:hypothetical protein
VALALGAGVDYRHEEVFIVTEGEGRSSARRASAWRAAGAAGGLRRCDSWA